MYFYSKRIYRTVDERRDDLLKNLWIEIKLGLKTFDFKFLAAKLSIGMQKICKKF